MIKDSLTAFVQELNQPHLLSGIDTLTQEQLQAFLVQLQTYAPFLQEQKALISSPAPSLSPISACTHFVYKKEGSHTKQIGESLLQKGKVGCLILAGGQGTRLGFEGPKGMVPVTPVTDKTLFQLFAERVKEASDWAGVELPLAIMTSEANHEQTVSFFAQNKNFGLSCIRFFTQAQLPFIDREGNWLLERPGRLLTGPDGNGGALHLFFSSGLWKEWKEKGVEYLNLIFVDNALGDPFDVDFIGFTAQEKLDAALKAIPRSSPREAMGVVVESEGKMRVIEYSEIPSNLGAFTLSSTGMFCVHMSFIEKVSCMGAFPLHLAKKTAKVYRPGQGVETQQIGKCERFIFDLLAYTALSAAFVCPREQVYAPLKNAIGEKSLLTVKQALLNQDRPIFL